MASSPTSDEAAPAAKLYRDGVVPHQAAMLIAELTRLPVQTLREVATYASVEDTVMLATSLLALDGQAEDAIWLKCLLVELFFIQGCPDESLALTSTIRCSVIPAKVAHSVEVAHLLTCAAVDPSAASRRSRAIVSNVNSDVCGEHAAVAAAVVLAAESWLDGRFEESLRWSAQAMRNIDAVPSPYWRMFSKIEYAARLADIGDAEEARSLQARVREQFQEVGYPGIEQGLQMIEIKLLLREGRWSDALADQPKAAATAGIDIGDRVYTPPLLAQLSVAACCAADAGTADLRLKAFELLPGSDSIRCQATVDWARLLLARSRGDEREVMRVFSALPSDRWMAVCGQMPGATGLLVRSALVTERADIAETIVEAAESLQARSSSIAYLAVAAQHARGLLVYDPSRVATAACRYEHAWPRMLAADDLVWQLGQSAASSGSPAGSQRWRLLTRREREVALHVVDGLTNHQIASRLSCSPHTVNFHLRNIFRKLDVKTRIEIARYVLARVADDE